MKNYKEFVVTTQPFLPEIISGLFWQFDISGIVEEDNSFRIFTNESSGPDAGTISEMLNSLVDQNIISGFSLEENIIEDKNWNEEWEKNINVIEVSDKIVIKPSFREYREKPGQIVITIDPKMSFGTGSHQSTKLTLQLMEKYVEKGLKVLDIGSGTCILSIASIKLGANNAVAIDNDEWCYENGIENCSLNNVSSSVNILLGDISNISENDFDIILANIQKNVLINIAEEIRDRLKKNGLVILSGLLIADEEDILNKYLSLQFKLVEKKQMDEWIALVLRIYENVTL
jgi:ribosomal protein L11 methyltransferase